MLRRDKTSPEGLEVERGHRVLRITGKGDKPATIALVPSPARTEQVILTEGGRPVARLSPIDEPGDRLAELIGAGVLRAPTREVHRSARAAHPGERSGE